MAALAAVGLGVAQPGGAEVQRADDAIVTVSSATELRSALKGAPRPSIINLRPGRYGDVTVANARGHDYLTLRASDPLRPPVVASMRVTKSGFLRFDGIVFASGDEPRRRDDSFHIVMVRQSDNVVFRNSEFHGSVDRNYDNDPIGLFFRNTSNVQLLNSRFHDLARGAKFRSSRGILVAGNRFEDIRSDGLNFAEVNRVRIEGNYLTSFHPNRARGDHPDYIQFWTNGTKRETTDVAIIGNVLLQGDGERVQSIFIGNEKENWYYRDFRIERNLIYQSHFCAISAYGVADATIARNTIVEFPGASMKPGINLFGTRGVTVSRNVAPVIRQKNDEGTRLEDNLLASDAYIWSSRRPTNLFVDPSAGPHATPESFYPKPGGPLDRGEAIGALQRNDRS